MDPSSASLHILRLLVATILLVPAPAAAEYIIPSETIAATPLQEALWTTGDGEQVGVTGAGQYIVQHEPYSPDTHPAMDNCYGDHVLGVAGQNVSTRVHPGNALKYTGHGTYTSSVICATWDVAGSRFDGVALGARLLHATAVLSPPGTEPERALWAQYGPRVITSSMESADGKPSADEWTPYAEGADMVFTWAAGNEGGDGSVGTANVAGDDGRIVVVGATTADGTARAPYSSVGQRGDPATYPTLVAPGCMWLVQDAGGPVGLYATANNRVLGEVAGATDCPPVTEQEVAEAAAMGYVMQAGTSFATPLVAGVFALMFEVAPQATAQDMIWLATRTADHFLSTNDTDDDGRIRPEEFHAQHGWQAGWGRINATRAVAAAHYMAQHNASAAEAVACHHVAASAGRLVLNPDGACRSAPTSPAHDDDKDARVDPTRTTAEQSPGRRAPGLGWLVWATAAVLGARRRGSPSIAAEVKAS